MKFRITEEEWESGPFLLERLISSGEIPGSVWETDVRISQTLGRFETEEGARKFAKVYSRGPRIVAEFTASEGEAPSTSPAGHP